MTKKLFSVILLIGLALGGFGATATEPYALKLEKDWAKDGVVAQKGIDKSGVQHVSVFASEGYWVLSPVLKANTPTKLHIYTNKTYDCSRAIVIPDLGFKKILKASGVVEVDIPAMAPGSTLEGQCGMGMYFFSISFKK